MRILYISDHGPYSNTFIRQDVELINKSHDILYLCFEDHNYYEHKTIKTKLVKYPSNSFKSKIRWRLEKKNHLFNWADKKFARKLKAEINKFNPSIIHCQFSYESVKLLQNFDSKKPVILNFRGYGASAKLKNKHYVSWLNKIAQKPNVYPIYVCESLKKNLINKGINFINKGIILYTGIDLDFFERSRKVILNSKKIFIQVGAFNQKKGQEVTIKAFAKFISTLKLKKHKLVFVGGGKNLNKCKKLVKEIKIENSVVFKGHLTQLEIIKELNKSDVFVHHSITPKNGDQEGIPNSILEAMSMELPILSTYHSGIPEAVIHKENGLLSNENDIQTFSNQMTEICNWQLLPNNRKRIEELFSLDIHIKKLKSFYAKIAKK